MSSINTASAPESRTIRHYFDAIASRYDFLNNFLSFRLDESWRKRARDIVLEGWEESVLDLGVGTGKFLKIFLEAKKWTRAAGLDFSSQMLVEARRLLPETVELVNADFLNLPFQHNSFDLVVSAFTLRSVKNMKIFLDGVYAVLTPGGKAAFLCLTRPQSIGWKILYYPYLKFYLPLIGGIFSGNSDAYQFLSNSILSFQDPAETVEMMRRAGFRDVIIHRFSMGMATMIVGKK